MVFHACETNICRVRYFILDIQGNIAKKNYKTLIVDLDLTATCSLSLGFNHENIFGDIFDVVKNEKEARNKSEIGAVEKAKSNKSSQVSDTELLRIISQKNQLQTHSHNYILQGSIYTHFLFPIFL